MNIINTEAYRSAFAQYLRKGTPIRLSFKDARTNERYVWRTQRDAKVRLSHRRNDGRIFSWADAPETGHPGAGFNCRCEAIPYVEGQTEFAFHDFATSLAPLDFRWTNADFLRPYYQGGGRPVTLLEIGHLREIAEYYAFGTDVEGVFRKLSDQIAGEARSSDPGPFAYDFEFHYDFMPVAFSHGRSTVSGHFVGVMEERGGMLAIRGETTFWFHDDFADPVDLGFEPGGTPYEINGTWKARFTADVFKDKDRSFFFKPKRK